MDAISAICAVAEEPNGRTSGQGGDAPIENNDRNLTFISPYIFAPLEPIQCEPMKEIIERNLRPFFGSGNIFAATERRLANFWDVYNQSGHAYIAISLKAGGRLIGGAGIGVLAGLPQSEGIGEIRDLVVDPEFRGQGLGAKLLQFCIMEAKLMGYRQLYLETTPQMEHAQRLFRRFGFKPVTSKQKKSEKEEGVETVPSYYLLDALNRA